MGPRVRKKVMDKKYHIHYGTGEVRRCKAKAGNCPFGKDAEHYSSAPEARRAFEKWMEVQQKKFRELNDALFRALDPQKLESYGVAGYVSLTTGVQLPVPTHKLPMEQGLFIRVEREEGGTYSVERLVKRRGVDLFKSRESRVTLEDLPRRVELMARAGQRKPHLSIPSTSLEGFNDPRKREKKLSISIERVLQDCPTESYQMGSGSFYYALPFEPSLREAQRILEENPGATYWDDGATTSERFGPLRGKPAVGWSEHF